MSILEEYGGITNLDELKKHGEEIAKPIVKEMRKIASSKKPTAEIIDNSWVVKNHKYKGEDYSFKLQK